MKKLILLFVCVFICISCSNNYLYGFKSVQNTYGEENKNIISKINSNQIDVNLFPNKDFNPKKYQLGDIFTNFEELDSYFIKLYGHKSKYNNIKQFNLAKKSGELIITSYDQVIRKFVFTEDGFQLVSQKGKLDLYELFVPNNNAAWITDNNLQGVFEKPFLEKYYTYNGHIYKCVIANGGHSKPILREIIYIK